MNISGDFMNKKTSALILKILRIALSIILCVTATVSMLGATLINVARDYLQSEDFHALIDTTDLGTGFENGKALSGVRFCGASCSGCSFRNGGHPEADGRLQEKSGRSAEKGGRTERNLQQGGKAGFGYECRASDHVSGDLRRTDGGFYRKNRVAVHEQ